MKRSLLNLGTIALVVATRARAQEPRTWNDERTNHHESYADHWSDATVYIRRRMPNYENWDRERPVLGSPEQIDEERFPKLTAYLKNPVSRRVRTNNHVERTNRMFRLLEKVRYKWRRRRTLVLQLGNQVS